MHIEELHKRMILGLPVIHKWPTTGETECRIKNILGWEPGNKIYHWIAVLEDSRGGTVYADPKDVYEKPYPKPVELPKV